MEWNNSPLAYGGPFKSKLCCCQSVQKVMKELDKIFFPFLDDRKIEEKNTLPAHT